MSSPRERKDDKSALSTFSVCALGKIAKKKFVGMCSMPDGRRACLDDKGKVSVIKFSRTEKITVGEFETGFSGKAGTSIQSLGKNKIILRTSDAPSEKGLVLNLENGITQDVEYPLSHSQSLLAVITTDDGRDYIFTAVPRGNVVMVYRGDTLGPFENFEIAGGVIKSLAAFGDKVLASLAGHSEHHHPIFRFFDGRIIKDDLKESPHDLAVGNKEDIALMRFETLELSEDDQPCQVSFGQINLLSLTHQLQFDSSFSLEFNEYWGGHYSGDIEKGKIKLISIPETRQFCMLFENDPNALVIYNCAGKSDKTVVCKLPAPCRSDFQMSSNGVTTYLTDGNKPVVLIYRPLDSTQAYRYNPYLMGALGSFLDKNASSIVASYLSSPEDELQILTLKASSVEWAMKELGMQYKISDDKETRKIEFIASDQKQSDGAPMLFTSDAPHLFAIKKMIAAQDDAERFQIAYEFIKANPKNFFAKQLMGALPPDLEIILKTGHDKDTGPSGGPA